MERLNYDPIDTHIPTPYVRPPVPLDFQKRRSSQHTPSYRHPYCTYPDSQPTPRSFNRILCLRFYISLQMRIPLTDSALLVSIVPPKSVAWFLLPTLAGYFLPVCL